MGLRLQDVTIIDFLHSTRCLSFTNYGTQIYTVPTASSLWIKSLYLWTESSYCNLLLLCFSFNFTVSAPSHFCLLKLYENLASKQHLRCFLWAKCFLFKIDSFLLPTSQSHRVNFGKWCILPKETWKSLKLIKWLDDTKLRRLPILVSKSSLDYDPGRCSLLFSAPFASNQYYPV